MNFLSYKNIYMIGIKGVGMTALAQIFKDQGINISGSDVEEVFITDEVLNTLKIKYYNFFNTDNIPLNTDLVIYSTAYGLDNIEMKEAMSRKITMISYPEALGVLFDKKYGIAIAGSHGKTTTTAMLGWILIQSNLKPLVVVGSKISNLETNAYAGRGNYMVIEADEYQNKFKYYNPKVLVITNIDYDHPDYFKDRIAYKNAFQRFINKTVKKQGVVIGCGDDAELRSMMKYLADKSITYGFNKHNLWRAFDIYQGSKGTFFKVFYKNVLWGKVRIALYGKHNVLNALAAIAAASLLKVSMSTIIKALRSFTGTSRRQEIMGKKNGVLVYDDYAHHPTEIKATLAMLKNRYPQQRIRAVFHPHTFTRTRVFLNMFAKSFTCVYKVIVLDIYGSAREKKGTVHSKDLVKKINTYTKNAIYIADKEEAVLFLKKNVKKTDIIITLGAGDVWKVGKIFLSGDI